ncbi:MAG: 4-hydroxythreonine-4-phosphate dehydrogenase PdxA [Spirochaetales bacterium]|jgi:4-hydroxythreonine-4-phosphate dehydrogenase|nr:4-hydroxythreonine-4-phosphate dehydrogenase PdxA [Spirochaetales bacterium]HOR80681.1 4-hydroxythreonine-4-phosphate dehydrogenase PdxA [Sphaerochaeta sp.]HRV24646.1 4-hydroxythreonine-4-phosphate dehydrogenase PdxA [Sphaerochaeta sp.]
MKIFGITLGDPCGIGIEVTIKALLKEPSYQKEALLFGPLSVLEYYNKRLKANFTFNVIETIEEFKMGMINVVDPHPVKLEDVLIGKVSALGGEVAFEAVRTAIEFARRKEISSVITAPLNKEALHLAGHRFAGHTEIFAHYAKGDSYAMLLSSPKLTVIHVSTHQSLRSACDAVTKKRVLEVIRLGAETMKKFGYPHPRIAVAGLNPHAGENGLFGDEEIRQIIPAIEAAKNEGHDVTGPIAPDTVFLRAIKGDWDIVVVMYHDQGHIPLKLLAFDDGVNITVGLDVVRTSVDHGTAFDIADKLIASEQSMLKAIELGKKL